MPKLQQSNPHQPHLPKSFHWGSANETYGCATAHTLFISLHYPNDPVICNPHVFYAASWIWKSSAPPSASSLMSPLDHIIWQRIGMEPMGPNSPQLLMVIPHPSYINNCIYRSSTPSPCHTFTSSKNLPLSTNPN